ncbi:MAG: AI-2E family transporter [Pseudomonadota bacterium]
MSEVGLSRERAAGGLLSRDVIEAAIRVGLIFLLVSLCFSILRPFIVVLVWSVILAVALFPGYARLKRIFGGRSGLAAMLVTLVVLALLLGPVGYLLSTMLGNLQSLASNFADGAIHIPPPSENLKTIPLIGASIFDFWALASDNIQQALLQVVPQLRSLSGRVLSGAAGAGLGFLQFIIAVIIAGVMVTHSKNLQKWARDVATRVAGERGTPSLKLAEVTIRNVARGVLGISLIQGVLAGLGMIVAGIPAAGILAFLVFFLGVLQIGPLLPMVATIAYAFVELDTITAVIYTLWAVPVTFMDNVLKPVVLSRGLGVPMMVIFLGVLGGTIAYGLVGLFFGPVVLALGYEFLRAWTRGGPEHIVAEVQTEAR